MNNKLKNTSMTTSTSNTQFQLTIKLDNREHGLIPIVTDLLESSAYKQQIKIEICALPLGDVVITRGQNELLIMERKTIDDLMASIKDGRYENQSYRLNGLENIPNHNIIYFIEGDPYTNDSGPGSQWAHSKFKLKRSTDIVANRMTLYSAIFSLNHYKGFSVYRTTNLRDTGFTILNMVVKLHRNLAKGIQPFYNHETEINSKRKTIEETTTDVNVAIVEQRQQQQQENINPDNDNDNENTTAEKEKEYCSVVKKVKKDNITENNIGEIMLCQIPNVSTVSASAIMAKFKTLQNLIQHLRENEQCLNDVVIVSNGNSRKIGKNVIANIVRFLGTKNV